MEGDLAYSYHPGDYGVSGTMKRLWIDVRPDIGMAFIAVLILALVFSIVHC